MRFSQIRSMSLALICLLACLGPFSAHSAPTVAVPWNDWKKANQNAYELYRTAEDTYQWASSEARSARERRAVRELWFLRDHAMQLFDRIANSPNDKTPTRPAFARALGAYQRAAADMSRVRFSNRVLQSFRSVGARMQQLKAEY